MKHQSIFGKVLLSLVLAYGGVLWLGVWHHVSHEFTSPAAQPVMNWLRDSAIVLLPVMLAVFAGTTLVQGLDKLTKGRLPSALQNVLSVLLAGFFSAAALVWIESGTFLQTGIGRDYAFEVSICRAINSTSFQAVDAFFSSLSDFQVARLYVSLKDFSSLLVVNLGLTAVLSLASAELKKIVSGRTLPRQQADGLRMRPSAVLAFSMTAAFGATLWLALFNPAIRPHWIQDALLTLPLAALAVMAALQVARRWMEPHSSDLPRSLQGWLSVSLQTVTVSAAVGLGCMVMSIWSAAHHQLAGRDLSIPGHWAYYSLLALPAVFALNAFVYFMVFKGSLWTARPLPVFQLQGVSYAQFGRQATAFSLAVMMIPSLLGLANSATVSAAGNNTCPGGAPVKTFNVSAIDVTIWLDRFGIHDPNGHMYVLDSMIPAVRAQEAAGPSSLSIGLRDDPIQPLAIRANMGDCVVIHFTNQASAAVGAAGTTSDYGIHIDGLAFQMDSAGFNIGNNPSSSIPSGGTATYTYWIPNDPTLEGAHYIHPGPGNRQAVAHGLFGTLNVEPPGSIYLNPTTGLPQLSGWEADIIPGDGRPAFRENVQVYHEIGNENETNVPVDISGNTLPVIDPHTDAYRPGSRAINYRSEPFADRLDFAPDQKSVVYGSYTFGDTTNVMPRGYLGDPTKVRLVHGGSEVFHVFHLHGGGIRWRFNPLADPTFDYGQTGLDKDPVAVYSNSARLDSQSMGPGEAFNLEIENGAGGGQQGAGEYLFHCHIAHHYFGGMWGYWRVFDTLQPDLQPLPDRTPMPLAVDSSGLIGKTINGQTITAENLDAWIRPQLPTQGVTKDINVLTGDTADNDASVWDWAVDPETGLYLGEPDRLFTIPTGPLAGNWPNYANVVPGRPSALIVDQQTTSSYQLNSGAVSFNSGGYIGDRPKLLFNPDTGRPAFPLLRPHIGKRPPFSPNGHSGAPYLGENGSSTANPVIPFGSTSIQPIDPWANRSDAICPSDARLQTFNIVGIPVPIQITRAGQVDPGGALFALAEDKDNIYADMDLRDLLAIRGNIGDCLAVTYVSELTDGGEIPYSKANVHIHHVQFDTQASDGVISGFSFEQSVRPYKIVDPQLTAGVSAGDTVLPLSSVAKFQPGVWIAIGMGTEQIEIRQIVGIDNTASTVTIGQPLNNTHALNEWAGTEFVQYRWFPDVELDNVFFHDHVNGVHGWSHGMVGQLVIEPFGSTYHDPVTGAEIRSGQFADIHTNNPLIPGVIDGSFREFVLWTVNDHTPVEATLNLKAEPWADRSLDPALRFSSNSPQGDPYTPIFRAYAGDPVVIRNINVGQGTNVLRVEGHRTFWEPRFTDALGISSSPIDAFHSTVSEKYTLVLEGGAGGPNHVPGDYIYHDGENRRFQSGAWGILRVLGAPVGNLQPLPGQGSIPVQKPICPAGAPVHNFAVSAVDVPGTAAGGGDKGNNLAFVMTSEAASVLNKTTFPEPLVLHVAQGECINVTLTNQRLTERASFHVGGLLRDQNSSGINIGYNSDQTVAPGQSRTYTYYADTQKLESVMISDFGGDNTGFDGMYGAIVVAPAGATFKNTHGFTTDRGTQVDVYVPGQAPYRDFTLFLADQDPVIGQNEMPYPADVSGPALINYRQVLNRVDNADMFNSAVNGDPTTPILKAYAGDPVKVHVLGAPGSEQLHVFNLGGMSWASDMYIENSSQWQSRAVGPWTKLDIEVEGGAGGMRQLPGDYFYGDIRRPFTQAGMWGIFRVLPNTCSTGGVAGTRCLIQTPPPSITSMSTVSGPSTGGTSVTINGYNFSTVGTQVRFGNALASNVSCVNMFQCVATSPSGAAGITDVTVNVYGQVSAANANSKFTYTPPAPVVTGVSPNSGLTDGGTEVSISGANFSTTPGETAFNFGANAAANVSCSSSTTCTATSPAGSAGIVNVVATVNGQSSTVSSADQFTYMDAAPSVVSVARVNAAVNNLNTVWYSVTFSEPVVNVDASDFDLVVTGDVSGAEVSQVNGSGNSWTVGVNTGTGSGSLRLDVNDDDSILDSGSNCLGGSGSGNGSFNSGPSYTLDKAAPSVSSITLLNPSNTSRTTVYFAVTFSEPVTGVDASDFSLTTGGGISGAVINTVTGSGTTRNIGISTGTGNGTIRLDVNDNDSIVDSTGNMLGGSGAGNGANTAGPSYTIDRLAPSVSSIVRFNPNPTNRSTVIFTITFAESVSGVDLTDFTLSSSGLSGAALVNVKGSGATRTVTVNTGSGNGTISLNLVDNDSIVDAAGNRLGGTGSGNGTFTTGQSYTVDKTAPVVVSSILLNPNPTTRTVVYFQVAFSESVTGITAADFGLTAPGITGAAVVSVTGTGSTRNVGVSTGTGSGTIRLNVIDDDSIVDGAGNRLGGTGSGNGAFNTGQTYNVR